MKHWLSKLNFQLAICPSAMYLLDMLINRKLSTKLNSLSKQYPVITLTGPRQSGKTTLVRTTFPDFEYVSLEEPDKRHLALDDPRSFLASFPRHVIIDEIQRAPDLLSYLQTHIDLANETGMYVLTGSQHFVLSEKISQSLAGRTALCTLLPLSIEELAEAKQPPQSLDEYLFSGGYPRLYDKEIAPPDFYPSYLSTYIERDIRQIKNVTDLNLFDRFIKLCAGRIGGLVNFSSLAADCGVSHTTARAWLTLLETSYIIFTLQPYHKNYNKRLVKSPKLYFYDTGLACSLLGLENFRQLSTHYLRGGIFENMVITELIKNRFNAARPPGLFFWRDKTGQEIDCVFDRDGEPVIVEAKSGATIGDDAFVHLKEFRKQAPLAIAYLVYGGDLAGERRDGTLVPWQQCGSIIS
jgi:uncharacterized protein